MSYSEPITMTYKFPAFAGISAAGQSANQLMGPAGLEGRLRAMVGIYTTVNTGAAGLITLRGHVVTADLYGTLVAPIGADETGFNDLVIADQGPEAITDDSVIPADTLLELDGDGGGTTGAADIFVTIDWY